MAHEVRGPTPFVPTTSGRIGSALRRNGSAELVERPVAAQGVGAARRRLLQVLRGSRPTDDAGHERLAAFPDVLLDLDRKHSARTRFSFRNSMIRCSSGGITSATNTSRIWREAKFAAAPCQYSSTTWEASSSRILWGAADIIR